MLIEVPHTGPTVHRSRPAWKGCAEPYQARPWSRGAHPVTNTHIDVFSYTYSMNSDGYMNINARISVDVYTHICTYICIYPHIYICRRMPSMTKRERPRFLPSSTHAPQPPGKSGRPNPPEEGRVREVPGWTGDKESACRLQVARMKPWGSK